jgi:C4-dicarboxylate transporter, DctM subunit
MDASLLSLIGLSSLIILMVLGVPIVYSLGFSACIAALLAYGIPSLHIIGNMPFSTLFNLAWTPLPLFTLLGTLIAESGMGKDLFAAASAWLSRIKGGLVLAGIVGEAMLASTLGTSAACIIVVGKVAVPEFDKQGYKQGYALGALLAGGVLGPLIPPSATFIVYAVLTNVSLGKLFIAGIMPGLLLMVFLCGTAFFLAVTRPGLAPKTFSVSWNARFRSLKGIWPIVVVMLSILGAIYFGIATPTETAGVGVFVVLVIAFAFFKMRWSGFKNAVIEATTVNGLIIFIIIAAGFFTYVMGSSNVADYISTFVNSTGMPNWMLIVMINIILLILGCFIDAITITLLTIPIFVPLISSLGMDPVWFGVVFCVNTQIGLITPPMGTDLFAVKTIFNIPTTEILKGVLPFLVSEIIFLAVISAFPAISLWLPGLMVSK